MNRLKPRLSYANVMSTLCCFLVLGGGAYAATQLPKSSVGSKQLRKNSVTTAKIRKEAITAAKVKTGALTGAQINLSSLGTVPTANSANTADTAKVANSLAPPEAWHQVGAPGEPVFQNKWENIPASPPVYGTAGFYKDRAGVVHLRGVVTAGTPEKTIFRLPAGYRPASGKVVLLVGYCGLGCTESATGVAVVGAGVSGHEEGAVEPGSGATVVGLEGISFPAEG